MAFGNPILLEHNSFYKFELICDNQILLITFDGEFDFEKYKQACLGAIDIILEYRIIGIISDHRSCVPITKEAQKWFTLEFTKLLKQKLGPLVSSVSIVAVTNTKDPVRRVIVSFLGYVFSLTTNIRCQYFDNIDDAILFVGVKQDLQA